MDKPRLVLIEWEDSVQPTANWEYLASILAGTEADRLRAVRCQSVGFLIYDGDDVKIVASNVGDIDGDHAQASGVIKIPVRCVMGIRRLSVQKGK